ncbi:MAG: cell division protein FtsZ [Elusimicrobia bacterium]|nr:cell division protein FtsZ [Elusimicrobiota bacterium]
MSDFNKLRPVLKVIGLGGAGGNAVNRMSEVGLRDVELIAANTDAQALERSQAQVKIQLGANLTQGLGAGGEPSKGQLAALDSKEDLREVLHGAHLVFITAGMGGGTGTGAAPVAAQVAKDCGALTIGVVTRPFNFEGMQRGAAAAEGIAQLREAVDTLLIVPNDKLIELAGQHMTTAEAFRKADDVLRQAVQSISDVITQSGSINMDLNDIKAVMTGAGQALIGIGEATGRERALEAAQLAVRSPLLENVTIDGARGLIVNIVGPRAMTMAEMDVIMGFLNKAASPEAKIKMGHVYDDDIGDRLRVTVIATGFPPQGAARTHAALGRLTEGGARLAPRGGAPVFGPSSAPRPDEGDLSKPAFMRWPAKVRKLK